MKQKLLLCLVLLVIASAKSQTDPQSALQEYLPPSPTAFEFMKYGEYPVGMYTGVPNISLPLFTIETREIKLPITLSYHASGIQVDQVASWAGLGWSLNTGGTISKIPRGIPDDETGGFLLATLPEFNNLTFDHYFFEDCVTGQKDTESDIYHYNVGGYSGKFFFDRQKNIRLIEANPVSITYQSAKFTIVTPQGTSYEFDSTEYSDSITTSLANPTGSGTEKHYISTWYVTKITSNNLSDMVTFTYESGTSFNTDQYGYSESTGNDLDMTACPPSPIPNVHSGGGSAISSQTTVTHNPKRLKEIVFPSGKIVLNRFADRQDIAPDRLDELVVYQKNGIAYNEIKSFKFIHDYFNSTHSNLYPTSNPSSYHRKRLKLLEVREYDKNGSSYIKHAFEYNTTMLPPIETNGKDYWGYYNGENGNINLIPLQPQQYLGNDVGAADRESDSIAMKAGILNKITYPTGGYTEFQYAPHEYETTEATLTTTTKNVFAVGQQNVIGGGTYLEDIETFTPNYSGVATISIEGSDLSSVNGTFPRITLQRSGSSGYLLDHSIDPYTYSYPLSPPEVETSFQVWLDEGVTYTLKAEAEGDSNSQEFDGAAYMIANIDYTEETGTISNVTKIAGGLRVEKVSSYSAQGQLSFSKEYVYGPGTLLTPETYLKEHYLDMDIQYWSNCNYGPSNPAGCVAGSTERRFYYGGTVRQLTMQGGSPVVYSSVDEIMVDGSGNGLGKTNYTYQTQTDAVYPATYSYEGGIMLLNKDWMGGQNVSTTTYEEGGSDFLTKKTLGHTLKKYDESYKMYKIVHTGRISGCQNVYQTDLANRFDVFEYPIYTGIKLVDSVQTITKYPGTSDVATTKAIFYDNDIHLQPTRTETTNSDGTKTYTKTYYPDDVISVSSLGADDLTATEFSTIEKLKAPTQSFPNRLHRISEPVQQETTVKDGTTELSTSIQRTDFKDWDNDLGLPASTDFVRPARTNTLKGTYSASTNPMEERINFVAYDEKGNVLEVSMANGAPISYIWGYDQTYPVAKVENATRSQIEALTGFGSNFHTGTGGLTTSQENTLRTLSDALVTTYTYDPLVGVTSITDPTGQKTTYEYDPFNRLKAVRDYNNNLISDYQYHYKGQN